MATAKTGKMFKLADNDFVRLDHVTRVQLMLENETEGTAVWYSVTTHIKLPPPQPPMIRVFMGSGGEDITYEYAEESAAKKTFHQLLDALR